jgi:AmpE protein
MTLFAILICIGIQRYFNLSVKNYWQVWLRSYVQGLTTVLTKIHLGNSYVITICIVLPILILIGGLEYMLHDVWFNLPNFILNVVVLFACLDAHKFHDGLREYFQAREQNDPQAAFRYGLIFLDREAADDLVILARHITRKLFLQADCSIFSVLFWYILAGPLGALIYTVINFLAQDQIKDPAAAKIKNILDWIPVRLVGLSYALVGNFAYGFARWRKNVLSGLDATHDFAYAAGLASLELEDGDVVLADAAENRLAIDLIDRALILWIVAIAVFTLVAWVS